MRKPNSLDFVEAASLSVAWLTAWRMVTTKARLQPGETVLIFGIGGSVSLAAAQIAGALGARPIVTSRDAKKLERARRSARPRQLRTSAAAPSSIASWSLPRIAASTS